MLTHVRHGGSVPEDVSAQIEKPASSCFRTTSFDSANYDFFVFSLGAHDAFVNYGHQFQSKGARIPFRTSGIEMTAIIKTQ